MSVEWGALADEWSEWMAAASVQLAVLIAVVGVAAWLVRRLSARYRYVLWSLVLIKVFLWPGLSAPWSVGRWVEMSPRIAEEERVAGANAAGGWGGRLMPWREGGSQARGVWRLSRLRGEIKWRRVPSDPGPACRRRGGRGRRGRWRNA